MLGIFFTLVFIGVLLWAVNTFIPMDGKVKQILNVVAIGLVVLWLLNIFGVFAAVSSVPVPRLR
jgi:hypothetical protein